MKSLGLSLTAAMGLIAFGMAGHAHAQIGMGMGMYNPPVSPYLNILRGGASPAINWFNIVQPQLQFGAAIGGLQAQQGALGQAVAAQNALGNTTGHPVKFGNYSHYYTRGIGMGGGMGRGGMGMGGMGMGGMGMGGMGMGGMGGMGMGGMGMGGMGMGGMGMGGMGMGR